MYTAEHNYVEKVFSLIFTMFPFQWPMTSRQIYDYPLDQVETNNGRYPNKNKTENIFLQIYSKIWQVQPP